MFLIGLPLVLSKRNERIPYKKNHRRNIFILIVIFLATRIITVTDVFSETRVNSPLMAYAMMAGASMVLIALIHALILSIIGNNR
jgi:hypothetical protein